MLSAAGHSVKADKSVARYDLCPREQDLQDTAGEERIISIYLFICPHSSFINEHTHIRVYPEELSEFAATYLLRGFTETSNY